ncbi:unnamed protein product [Notodromas monacha]|uniref:Protein artemis n=1 Tax=Notodromas monacha TaxID=399045 RepID=A0A7R9GI44_9CRUS|nr:unnamed protein product [Notodromas monacha]CAG0922035.1 unnamed protein product [Notodromas monacha]
MTGLDTFNYFLQEHPETSIYMSKLTRDLLLKIPGENTWKYDFLRENIRVMTFNRPEVVHLDAGRSVSVEILPSGHCPGAVMFLFQEDDVRVLYTGDIRLNLDQLRSMRSLHRESGEVLPLRALHIDTTFCYERMRYFPDRKLSAEALKEFVITWLKNDVRNEILFKTSARVGHEYLMVELSQALKVAGLNHMYHVNRAKFELYQCIPEIAGLVTTKSGNARMHLSCPCWMKQDFLRIIKPSTWVFTLGVAGAERSIIEETKSGWVKLFFSMHSSGEEIAEMICHLRPANVYANVLPENGADEINQLLDKIRYQLKAPVRRSNSSDVAWSSRCWDISKFFGEGLKCSLESSKSSDSSHSELVDETRPLSNRNRKRATSGEMQRKPAGSWETGKSNSAPVCDELDLFPREQSVGRVESEEMLLISESGSEISNNKLLISSDENNSSSPMEVISCVEHGEEILNAEIPKKRKIDVKQRIANMYAALCDFRSETNSGESDSDVEILHQSSSVEEVILLSSSEEGI